MFGALLVSLPWAGVVLYVLKQHAEERRHLLNRIQAPVETVIREVSKDLEPDPEPAHWDEEKAFWATHGVED